MDNTFWEEIAAHAAAYLPQWHYDNKSSEPASALLTACASLLLASRQRAMRIPERLEAIFLNEWNPQPQPLEPASVCARLQSAIPMMVPTGTAFYAGQDGSRIWETQQSIYLSRSQPAMHVFVSESSGKITVPTFPTPEKPICLFAQEGQGVQRRSIRFEHTHIFQSTAGCMVTLRILAPVIFIQCLRNPMRMTWFLVSETEEQAIPNPVQDEKGALCFNLPALEGAQALEARALPGAPLPPDMVDGAFLSTVRGPCDIDRIACKYGFVQETSFLPFGEEPELWDCCYLSCGEVFTQRGATLTVNMTLSCKEMVHLLPIMGEEQEYRPVMRHLPTKPPVPQPVFVEQVAWEYWNGAAWLPLPGTGNYQEIFRVEPGQAPEPVSCILHCPEDAEPCEMLGEKQIWFRWRVLRSHGSSWLPRISYAPMVTALCVFASMTASPQPATVWYQTGLQEKWLPLGERGGVPFPPLGGEQDEWWIGFTEPPKGTPFQFFLEVEGEEGGSIHLLEAGPNGNKRTLAFCDNTGGLAHTGLISCEIPADATIQERFGRKLWWLCIVREQAQFGHTLPRLKQFYTNAVMLQAQGTGMCVAAEPLAPLQGGIITGNTITDSFGGSQEETQNILLKRAREERHHRERTVSQRDISELICGQLRDVARISCVTEKDTLFVAVLMRDTAYHAFAFIARKNTLHTLLTTHGGFASLGLKIQILEPVFYPICINTWVRAPKGMPEFEAARKINNALNGFLHPIYGGFTGEGWAIGGLPRLEQLRACLLNALPGIRIHELLATAVLPNHTERPMDEIVDPFAVPISGTHVVHMEEIMHDSPGRFR